MNKEEEWVETVVGGVASNVALASQQQLVCIITMLWDPKQPTYGKFATWEDILKNFVDLPYKAGMSANYDVFLFPKQALMFCN